MRIVMVNWARIWDGASEGGGVNGYCQGLALDMVDRGHEVISLCGGRRYVAEPSGCFVRRHEDWLGIRVFEVFNSPVVAPSIAQYRDPVGEVSAPELEDRVGELMEWLAPDVVHFHNIEGFSVGCVDRCKATGARVVFSLHNYHTVCPQVYLMQGHRTVCQNADGGLACDGCIEAKTPAEERTRLMVETRKSLAAASETPTLSREEAAAELMTAAKSHLRLLGAYHQYVRARKAERVELPGVTVSSAADATGGLALDAEDARGQTAQVLGERHDREPIDLDAPERQPITNDITPEPGVREPKNDYGRRRVAMIDMLNGCDSVLAVSSFVRDKFVSLGVNRAVDDDAPGVRAQAIGTRMTRVVELANELVFDPPSIREHGRRPIRLVFMGYNNYYKGLPMLGEALELLTPDQLRWIDLSIHALEGHVIEWLFRRLEPRLAKLTFMGGYRYHDIPWILGGKDMGVVCSVWWDNGPQTVFEYLSCGVPVLGAELGGIPDFVRHGENGLLFRGNDRRDLAKRLGELIDNPEQLDDLRAGVRGPKSMAAHGAEIESLYQGLLQRSPAAG